MIKDFKIVFDFGNSNALAYAHPHHVHTCTHTHTHTLHSPLMDVTWTYPVPSDRVYFDPAFNNNILLAHNLQSSDAGTFTCRVPSVGNFSVQLQFIGTTHTRIYTLICYSVGKYHIPGNFCWRKWLNFLCC